MQEQLFSVSDLDELILIMQMSGYNAAVQQKWQRCFEQMRRERQSRDAITATRRSESARYGWEKRRQHQQKGENNGRD